MYEPSSTPHTKPLTDAQILYHGDLARLRGQRGALLELLTDEEWHPNYECAGVGGLSFQCSIYAFRREGWIIESRPKKGGIWEYRLVGKGDPPPHPAMSRPQRLIAGHYLYVIETEIGSEAASKVQNAVPEWMRTRAQPFIAAEDAVAATTPRDSEGA